MSARKIENLFIWTEARAFVKRVYQVFEGSRDWGFKDQIQRASVSIMNNIAEGAESGSDSAFARYLNISRGSCSEVKSMLYLAEDLKYIDSKDREELQTQLYKISTGIINLINNVSKQHTTNGKAC